MVKQIKTDSILRPTEHKADLIGLNSVTTYIKQEVDFTLSKYASEFRVVPTLWD